MTNQQLLIAENAAAISDRAHSHPARYRDLYHRLADKAGGFPGIWSLIAECAIQLQEQHPQDWEDNWIETCWAIGDQLLDMEDLVPARDLVRQALQSLPSATNNHQPKGNS